MTAVPPPLKDPTPAKTPPRRRAGWRGWEKAHHRAIMLAIEGIGAGIAGILILLLLLAVRLELAPLQVNFLTPPLVAWLDLRLAPFVVEIDHTSAHWATGRSTLDLTLTGLTVFDASGRRVLSVPAAAAPVNLRALLLGRLRPVRLIVEHPRIALIRMPDGRFGFSSPLPAPSPPVPVSKPVPPPSLAAILGRITGWFDAPGRPGAGASFNALSIVDGEADIDDRVAGFPWRIDHVHIDFRRRGSGFVATSGMTLAQGGRSIGLAGSVGYAASERALRLKLAFQPIDPSRWGSIVPPAAALFQRLHLPIGGTVAVSATLDPAAPDGLRLGASRLDLSIGAGSLVDPRLSGGAFPIAGAGLSAGYDPVAHRLFVDRLTLDVGGPVVTGDIRLDQVPASGPFGLLAPGVPALPLHIDLTARNVACAMLPALWPPDFHVVSRDWITTHILEGTIREVDFSQTLLWQPGSAAPPVKRDTASTMMATGITIQFIKGLPPATGLDFTAHSDAHDAYYTIAPGGHIADLALTGGTAHIDKLGDPSVPSDLNLDIGLRGPVRTLVAMLDSGHLHLAKPFPFKPRQVDGLYDGRIRIGLPLTKDVPTDAVRYGATAKLENLALGDAAPGIDLSAGAFDLALDNAAISLAGTAALDGMPAHIVLSQRQSGPLPHPMRIALQTRIGDALRRRLKLDPPPGVLSGPIGVDMTLESSDKNHATASVALDLTPAAIALDAAGWHKPAGQPGTAHFQATLVDGHAATLSAIDLRAPGLAFQGDMTMGADGLPRAVAVRRIHLGESDAAGTIGYDAAGWHVVLAGPTIDLAPFLKTVGQKITPEERRNAPPLDLDVRTARLIFGPGRAFGAAHLAAAFVHENMMRGALDARIGPAAASFRLATPQDGGRLSIASGDMGGFLRILGVSDHIKGGTLKIDGTGVMAGDHRRYAGHVEGTAYRLVHAPIMAKLLAVASLSSIASQLSGQGIPFSHLSAGFSFDDGLVMLTHAHAYGDAIGINASGTVDLDAKMLSVQGSLVPAYLFNSALGKIPLIGKALVGGVDQGLFAANFAIGGPIDDPRVVVNPLSVLAPGLLRGIPLFNAPMPQGAPALPK